MRRANSYASIGGVVELQQPEAWRALERRRRAALSKGARPAIEEVGAVLDYVDWYDDSNGFAETVPSLSGAVVGAVIGGLFLTSSVSFAMVNVVVFCVTTVIVRPLIMRPKVVALRERVEIAARHGS